MKIKDTQQILAECLAATRLIPPEDTHLHDIGQRIYQMSAAYEEDGLTFCASGDLVNALAAFTYGFGWLHFGYAYGVFGASAGNTQSCPFSRTVEVLPEEYRSKLVEKTRRYQKLLNTAISSVAISADRDTSSSAFSERIIFIARHYSQEGGIFLAREEYEKALSRFSYGHGWLDAAVTSGLFQVFANRDIFTV